MGTTSRTEIVHKESMSSPGPGTYDSPSKLGQNGPKVNILNKLIFSIVYF